MEASDSEESDTEESDIGELRGELLHLRKKNKELRDALRVKNEKERQMKELCGKLEDALKRNGELQLGIDGLKTKNSVLEQKQKKLFAEITSLKIENKDVKVENESKNEMLSKVQKELEFEVKFRQSFDKQKLKLSQQLLFSRKEADQSKRLAAHANSSAKSLEESLKSEKQRRLLQLHRAKISSNERKMLKEIAKTRAREKIQIISEAEVMKRAFGSLEQEVLDLREVNNVLKDEILLKEDLMSSLRYEIERNTGAMATLRNNLKEAENRCKRVQEKWLTLQAKIHSFCVNNPKFSKELRARNRKGNMVERLVTKNVEEGKNSSLEDFSLKFALLMDDCLHQLERIPKTSKGF